MRLCSIASGSSGNCIYVGDDRTHLLVDTGISKKRVEQGLHTLGIKGDELAGILVTHEHIDHIQGLGVFSRKYKIPIYGTLGTLEGIRCCSSLGKLPEGILREIRVDEEFTLGSMKICPFAISHDAREPSGYRIENQEKSVAVATDLGKYDNYIVEHLKNLNAVVLEANHDIHMLEVGPYPYPLKRRVMGDRGHLSNELSGRLLSDILHDGLQYVVLGHLSKENNYEELAYETVKLEISFGDNPYRGEDIPMMVAKRDTVSEIITLD
ncbi:MAG: MBL fold metallo-hydrolase [Dorea sp.]|jgi:phosphoribosyl 1,2-cyclic phosphodiesterase|nr:MBL fold metallo-hydrolase [Dorea sp.]MCI9228349.1 MBL fold metallo-hydrolase [Dorea sp.]